MFKRAYARSDRSPLRRRLERMIQFAALLFFIVLGSAIYQNVSKGTPSPRPTRTSLTEPRANNVAPSEMGAQETRSAAASANELAPANVPPNETKPSGERSSATASSDPPLPPRSAPPSQNRPSEEEQGTTATIKPEPEAALLSPASLDCATGAPTSWEFANVELIDSAAGRATSLVTSCRVSAVSPVGCQNTVIVGVGVASSRGINAIESARALRRGVNLASALKKDLQARCATSATVSAYVLNLGRYNDERDEPDQRKVIALVATGSNDADKAAMDAVVTFAKSDPKINHYPICELYKLDDAGRPTPVPAQQNSCGEQTGRTASRQ